MAYAEATKVPVSRTLDEIRELVRRNKGEQFQYGEQEDRIAVGFTRDNRTVRFVVDFEKAKEGATQVEERRIAQRRRQRARALLLVIKTKFESVESGIETFEEAFLAEVMMPDGATVAKHIGQTLIDAYASGQTPPNLLPDYSGGRG